MGPDVPGLVERREDEACPCGVGHGIVQLAPAAESPEGLNELPVAEAHVREAPEGGPANLDEEGAQLVGGMVGGATPVRGDGIARHARVEKDGSHVERPGTSRDEERCLPRGIDSVDIGAICDGGHDGLGSEASGMMEG
jgi:hypothetical protein